MNITEDLKKKVWKDGLTVNGYSPNEVRKDACGAFMIYEKYGDRESDFGWEIDHVCPKSLLEELGYKEDEIDNIDNLRPMHWRNNLSKGNDYPSYTSVVTSSNDDNVESEEAKIVNSKRQAKIKSLYKKLK